jgi:rubredoxin
VILPKQAELNLNRGHSMKTYQCVVCGFIYDEAAGMPEDGIAPGTRWDDIPADWSCPDCGVAKADFEMVEI